MRDDKQTQRGRAADRSPSPSSYSTASSGSPLVRNDNSTSSGKSFAFSISSNIDDNSTISSACSSSGKRPAPTRIAAAQLNQLEHQQQQQHHQQTATKQSSSKSKWQNGNKLSHIMMATKQQQNDQNCRQSLEAEGTAMTKRSKPLATRDEQRLNDESFGYNFGKLMAYRASRFNEFWSANKMRYLNLACLLMTLVCLLTIFLFSKTSMVSVRDHSSVAPSSRGFSAPNSDGSPSSSTSEGSTFESVDSLGKQALVSASSKRMAQENSDEAAASGDASRDGFDVFDELAPSSSTASSKRDMLAAPTLNGAEREVEETTAAPSARAKLEPLLGDMLDDFDGFNLVRSIRSQLLNASPSGSAFKPIIRRDKNGATIIIGGSMVANETVGDMPSPGSILEKLLPPSLLMRLPGFDQQQPPVATIRRTFQGPGTFGATITIQSREPSPFMRSSLFAPDSPIPMWPFSQPMRASQSPISGHLFLPPVSPPQVLLAKILKAAAAASDDSSLDSNTTLPSKSVNESRTNSTTEPLNTQASHLLQLKVNSTSEAVNQTRAANATGDSVPSDSEVQMFDVSHLPGAPPLGPLRPHSLGGSMIVISSSSSSTQPDSRQNGAARASILAGPMLLGSPFGDSSVVSPLLSGSSSRRRSDFVSSRVSPILRAILGNVMSDSFADSQEQGAKESSELDELGSSSMRGAMFAGRSQGEGSSADDWDELHASSRLRTARHRLEPQEQQQEQSEDAPPMDHVLFPNPFDMSAASLARGSLALMPTPLTQGRMLRQTIIRPGVTIERIMSGSVDAGQEQAGEAQQVGEGVRSQSISRIDASPEQEPLVAQEQPSLIGRLLGQESALLHRRADDSPRSLFMSPFFSGVPLRSARQMMFAPSLSPSSSSPFNGDDEDESDGISPDDEQSTRMEEQAAPPAAWSPRLRVARVRVAAKRVDAAQLPTRFTAPESKASSDQSSSSHRQSEKENQQIEERLNRAISTAAAAAAAAASGQSQHQQQPAGGQQHQHRAPITEFTSPTSPLFGFPATEMHHSGSQAAIKPFVYHSNNEPAKHFAGSHATQARSNEEGPSQHLPPPAAVVMGRRLDDGPFSPMAPDEQQQQRSASTMESFRSIGNARRLQQPISLATDAAPQDHRHQMQSHGQLSGTDQFRTIVV